MPVKAELRASYLEKRKELSEFDAHGLSLQIINEMYDSILEQDFDCIACYMPIQNEPDLKPLYTVLLSQGHSLVFPQLYRGVYRLAKVSCLKKDFVKGKFGTLEPRFGCKVVQPKQVSCWLVPGIVFDQFGYRVGYGKGTYDRFLKQVSSFKWGICYDFQVVHQLQVDSWDQPMTHLMTNYGIIVI